MSDIELTHDAAVNAFSDAGGVVESTDDDGVTFSWDEENIVRVDAPSDLTGAFDTDRFYKIEDATVARPIKQPYAVGDGIKVYKKPAEELRKAAWSFDNTPYTITHPDTGMVKDVHDVHGFWRNVSYDDAEDRLRADLYVPTEDDEALEFVENNQDVSVGFYNRVHSDYDGDTGDLTDDDVDGFQVDMFGNHIAGVKNGRCSGEDGCGLDNQDLSNESSDSIGSECGHTPHDHGAVLDTDHSMTSDDHDRDYVISPPTADYTEDGTYYAIGPDETTGDSPKYPINSCSDVNDAWHLRGHGDYDISQDTLESRIKSKAQDLGCEVPGTDETSDADDCNCGTNNQGNSSMSDENDFNIPDLSVDALADKNEDVEELREERDSLRSDVDEMRSEIEDAFDSAENFSVDLDEDECPCEAVTDLVEDLDQKATEVEDLEDELSEYREDEIEDRLDTLEDLGADRDEWEDAAEEADDPLSELDEEIDRREEVLESADVETNVKNVDNTTDSPDETPDDGSDNTMHGGRKFGRGYGA